jgi:hypothetical protein
MSRKTEGTAPEPEADRGTEGFLERWSRRKHEASRHSVTDEPDEASPTAPVTPAQPAAPEKVLTDADMPPIDSLTEDSDFSPFMSQGVSEELRRTALRKLFRMASFNQRFPLESEYYDSHGFQPLGNVITHEMREELERQAAKLKEGVVATVLEPQKPQSGHPCPAALASVPSAKPVAAKPVAATRSQTARTGTLRRRDAPKTET